jgi:tRNA threonylcarbamoyladenosine biosynthesis protein TsaE
VRVRSDSPAGTEEIGKKIGECLVPGAVVCLYGDLGAGKTTMVRGIASVFGIQGRDLTSASFTVIAAYPVTPPFYHIHHYRITSQEDLESTGIWDIIGGEGISVIEWAEHMGELPGEAVIRVSISDCGENSREVVIEGIDEETWNNL